MLNRIPLFTFTIAGLIHLLLASEHYEHAPAHGFFFLLAGFFEITWALLFWRRPSTRMVYTGILLSGSLLVLWTVTRLLPPPFASTPAPVEAGGLLCKLCELAGAAALASMLFLRLKAQSLPRPKFTAFGIAFFLSIAGGLLVYGISMAAQPSFPWLAGSPHDMSGGSEHEPGEMEQGHGSEPLEGSTAQSGTVVLAGGFQVSSAWARPGGVGDTSAVYFNLNNPTLSQDLLTGASSPIAREIQFHLSEIDSSGVARMRPQEYVDIPAGWQVEFKPGGLHLMLVDLLQELSPGDTFILTLYFEKAGSLDLPIGVEQP